MTAQTIDDLARYLKEKRMTRDNPPALLLGAGAPLGAGIPAMRELMPAAFQCDTFEQFCVKIGPLTDGERFLRLFEFLQARGPDPFQVTPGFRSLGAMIAEVYFDLILTTNFDPLLEDALATAGLRRKHYLLLINPLIHTKWFDTLLADRVPRVKLVKLHGDLFHRVMAWTPQEMEQTLAQVGPKIASRLADRDLIVVGHSLADSKRIRNLAESVLQNRALWFVNPGPPPDYIAAHKYVRAITGEHGKFEIFFPKLAAALGLGAAEPTPPRPRDTGVFVAGGGDAAHQTGAHPILPAPPAPAARATPGAAGIVADEAVEPVQTVDDLMNCIVGIAVTRNEPECTGFVLRKPHRIVSDGYSGRRATGQQWVDIITPDGRRLKARNLSVGAHAFGPWVLEAPEALGAPGLRVDARPLAANLPIRAGVAAGFQVGVSSGFVRNPVEIQQAIAQFADPIGHLVAVEVAVAPGSAGAPVVDESFAVRGLIAAGSADLDKPLSFMYPAYRWMAAL